MALSFRYSTPAQLHTRLRGRYQQATGLEACRLAAWFLANLTDRELGAAFQRTMAELAALKSRLDIQRVLLTSVNAVQGE